MKHTGYWNELEMLSNLNLCEKQKLFINWQKEHYKDITVTQLSELSSDIRKALSDFASKHKMVKHECYSNSCKFIIDFFHKDIKEIRYCEGKVHVCSISIEHAWIHIYMNDDTDFYFDPTKEFILDEDTTNDIDDYVSLIELNKDEVFHRMLKHKYYGNWFNEEFIDWYKINHQKDND